MKKQHYLLLSLIFLLLLSASACGKKEEDTAEFHTEDEVTAEEEPQVTEDISETAPKDSWANHYYNRGIYVKDGYTYRQLADGLYRRAHGTDSWELLCEIQMNYGPGLACYGDRLYFTGYEEEADAQGSGWNNAVFYYDLDTGESGNLLNVGTLTGVLSVYDGCLYVQSFTLEEGNTVYDGYRLDENGEIVEELNPESEDFLCLEQNQYGTAEVIPAPACAAMLDGKTVLRQQKDESGSSYFLRDFGTGEDKLLFDASDILAIMEEGICYFPLTGEDENLMYYSFADGTSRELPMPEFWQGDNRGMNPSTYTTWDQEALYFFDYGNENEIPKIVRISLSDGSLQTIAEGEVLMETEAYRINQVDDEYFYHGDQMYPLP